MGFTLRSVLLWKGTRVITTRMSPPAVLPSGDTSARSTGPARSATALGISPFRESLAIRPSVSPPARWMLPWVLAFQGPSSTALPGPSPGFLSRASQTWRLLTLPAGAPEYRSAFDPPLRLLVPRHPSRRGSPHRLCAPAQSRTFRRETYRDMGSPDTASCIAVDRPMLLSEPLRPTAVAGIGLRCRAFALKPKFSLLLPDDSILKEPLDLSSDN
jgi:hypothetical protein